MFTHRAPKKKSVISLYEYRNTAGIFLYHIACELYSAVVRHAWDPVIISTPITAQCRNGNMLPQLFLMWNWSLKYEYDMSLIATAVCIIKQQQKS